VPSSSNSIHDRDLQVIAGSKNSSCCFSDRCTGIEHETDGSDPVDGSGMESGPDEAAHAQCQAKKADSA